jgi:heptose-I-phosphate ethanolaminephosphotransferase
MTSLELLELLVVALALFHLPRIYRECYATLHRNRMVLILTPVLVFILCSPEMVFGKGGARTSLSGLLAVIYALPLMRKWNWLACTVFLATSFIIAFDVLPLVVFSLEGCPPSEYHYLALFQTNPREGAEYLRTHIHFLQIAFLLSGVPLLLILSRHLPSGRNRKRILVAFLALACVNLVTAIPPGFLEVAGNYRREKAAWRTMAEQRRKGLEGTRFTARSPATPRRILLVINESISRRHMGLYGYGQPTTPNLSCLEKAGHLFVFDDVISPHCLTMQSLEKVLTNSNNENHQPFSQSVGILDIFQKAGFRVSWVSNQAAMGVWDNQVSVLASSADRTVYSSNRIGARLDAAPDGILLPLLEPVLSQCSGKALVVCHLMGAHADYHQRVDAGARREWARGVSGLSPYDEAIRYDDFILSEILRKAEHAGFDTAIILSDHGECPHPNQGHSPANFDPEMVEIPFLVWLAPEYRQAHPGLVAQLRGRIHTPFMTDGFFHTLADLAEVECSLLDPTRSLLNPAFKERPRRVVDGRIPFSSSPSKHGGPFPPA